MSTASEVEGVISIALPLAYELVKDLENGSLKSTADIVRRLFDIGEKVVPDGDLAPFLTDAARTRGELAADIASDVKFTDENGDPE